MPRHLYENIEYYKWDIINIIRITVSETQGFDKK